MLKRQNELWQCWGNATDIFLMDKCISASVYLCDFFFTSGTFEVIYKGDQILLDSILSLFKINVFLYR